MGQSFARNLVHITFCTKGREAFISRQIEKEVFSYIAGVCKNLDCPSVIVGGYLNHIHVLCVLSKKIPLMKLVQEIKCQSSRWIKERFSIDFSWSDGYCTISTNYRDVDVVRRYILNQAEHHQQKDFTTEYRDMLKENDIEYDEKYLWS